MDTDVHTPQDPEALSGGSSYRTSAGSEDDNAELVDQCSGAEASDAESPVAMEDGEDYVMIGQ